MLVKELIEKLKKCDKNLRVLVTTSDECAPDFDNDLEDCAEETLTRERDGFVEKVVSLYYDKGSLIDNLDEYDEDDEDDEDDEENRM